MKKKKNLISSSPDLRRVNAGQTKPSPHVSRNKALDGGKPLTKFLVVVKVAAL